MSKKDVKRSLRGQARGETQKALSAAQNKNNLNFKNKKTQYHNPLFSFTRFRWVGGTVALIALATSALMPSPAYAAERSWGNIDVAKKVIENVAPVVTQESKIDKLSASYVFASDFLQKPLVAETVVTKEELPKPVIAPKPANSQAKPGLPKPTVKTAAAAIVKVAVVVGGDLVPHKFPYGYCTYYVAQKRTIPWGGNAGTWLNGAKSYGFATGNTPKVGAIVVTSEGGYAGHVAYVEAVNGDQITISEMNYTGFGRTSTRTISASYGLIKGYIY